MNSIEKSALGKGLWDHLPGHIRLACCSTWDLLRQQHALLAWRLGGKRILALVADESNSGWPIVEAPPPLLEGFGLTALVMAKGIARRPTSWSEELPFVVQVFWMRDDVALIWVSLPNKFLLYRRLRSLRSRTQAGYLRLVGFVDKLFYAEYSDTHECLHWETRWDTGFDADHVWLRDKPGKNSFTEMLDSGWIPTPARILELGCGDGHDAALLAERGYRVLAVDYSATAVELTRARCAPYGDRVEVRQLDVTDESQNLGVFDAVLDFGCFHTIFDKRAYVRNLARWTRPGSKFMFMVGFDLDTENLAWPNTGDLFCFHFATERTQKTNYDYGDRLDGRVYFMERLADTRSDCPPTLDPRLSPGLESLLTTLNESKDPTTVIETALGLGELRQDQAIPALLKLLWATGPQESRGWLQTAALVALRGFGSNPLIETALLKFFDQHQHGKYPRIKQFTLACQALRGSKSPQVLHQLLSLGQSNPRLWEPVLETIGTFRQMPLKEGVHPSWKSFAKERLNEVLLGLLGFDERKVVELAMELLVVHAPDDPVCVQEIASHSAVSTRATQLAALAQSNLRSLLEDTV